MQKVVALSSAEAEWYAMNAYTRECVYLRDLLTFCGLPQHNIITFCDNQACIRWTQHPCNHNARKHISLSAYHAYENTQNGIVAPRYIDTKSNLADAFTKLLKNHSEFKRAFSTIVTHDSNKAREAAKSSRKT